MADPSTYRPAPGSIPTSPGVYRFRDEHRRVVYVGKAKNLRSRLTSYFQDIVHLHPRTATMVTSAASVEWTVVNTEVEALQLEYSWIKEFDPRFNVKYRDDKSYPWLAVTVNEEFPRVMVGRGAKKRGSPLLRALQPRVGDPGDRRPAAPGLPDALLQQRRVQAVRADRPALPARLHRQVLGAVRGRVSAVEHRVIVDDFCDFMAGQTTAFVKRVEKEMYAASSDQDYERAARLRDDLGALNRAMEKQQVVLGDGTDADVVALSEDPLEVAVQIFYVRGGRIRGQRGWVADKTDDADTAGLVERFLLQLYDGEVGDSIPREVLVPALPEDTPALEEWLATQRGGGRVAIRVPQRGDKKALQETVARNALQALGLHKTKRASDLTTRNRALEEIQVALELPTAPLRVECYDISNLQGTEVVASMVVFEDGLARKSEYRRFVIKGVEGQNDVASMHEVITRRFRRLLDERVESGEFADAPDEDRRPAADRPGHRPAQEVRLRPRAGRRRRRPAAGRRCPARPRRARHRRRAGRRAGQAPGGGVAARPGGPGDPAAHQRGALPPPADPRRGAPLRDHPPPVPAVQEHGREPARRRAGTRRGASQEPAQAVRLAEEAAGCHSGGDRRGARHRHPHGRGDRHRAGRQQGAPRLSA